MNTESSKSAAHKPSAVVATKRVIRRLARGVLPLVESAAGAVGAEATGKTTMQKPTEARASEQRPKELQELSQALFGTPDSSFSHVVAGASAATIEARLVQGIIRGASLSEAAAEATREMLKQGHTRKALALGHSLQADSETQLVGNVVLGMCFQKIGTARSAWALFQTVAGRMESTGAAQEFYAAAFESSEVEAARILREDIAAHRHERWNVRALLRTAQKSMHSGNADLARVLIDAAMDKIGPTGSPYYRKELKRLETWLPGGTRREAPVTNPGTINFGVMSYQQPDSSSRNVGDFIQTIASLGHVVRHTGFTFTGDPDLVDYVSSLRKTLKPEREVSGTTGSLNLLELHRDGNTLQDLPEPTWALLFGWFMHDTFGLGFNLPLNPHLRPIPISVFIRYPEMLTEEAVEYLRRYAPVGCRDWQSVALLNAAGVPAFFSGCLTTTVDTLFNRPGPDTRNSRIFVDSPKTGQGDFRKQEVQSLRDMSFVENLEQARNWVETYNSTYNQVVTSRLHCYLPARSVGSQVTFLPKNPSDNRFGGLYDLPDEAFDSMRNGFLDKLGPIMSLIASGADEETVYSTWRRLCAPDVAAAQARLEAVGTFPTIQASDAENFDAALRGATRSFPSSHESADALDVVVDCRRGEEPLLPELISSATKRTATPLRWWIVATDLVSAAAHDARDAANGAELHIVQTAKLNGTSTGIRLTAGNRQNLALAALPRLLSPAGMAVILPAASRVAGDISELKVSPTAGGFVSARASRRRNRTSGFDMLRRVANRQKAKHEAALRLNFQASQSQVFDFIPLDASVMVIDLAEFQRENATEDIMGLIGAYGMSFEEAIASIVGSNYQELSPSWNFEPSLESIDNAKLYNWRGSTTPADKLFVPTPSE